MKSDRPGLNGANLKKRLYHKENHFSLCELSGKYFFLFFYFLVTVDSFMITRAKGIKLQQHRVFPSHIFNGKAIGFKRFVVDSIFVSWSAWRGLVEIECYFLCGRGGAC